MKINEKKIIQTTFVILEKKSWKNISIEDVKRKTNLKVFDDLIKDKRDLLKKINQYIDYELSKKLIHLETSNNKDMLFEIIMMRFDILQNYRKGMLSIFHSFKKNPEQLIFLLPDILDSINLMLKNSNFSSKGVSGQLKIKGLFIIYTSVFFVWASDNTSSLDKTMIALDNYLDRAGKILNFIK